MKKEIQLDQNGKRKFGIRDKLAYAAAYLEDHESFSGLPLAFDLKEGNTKISIRPQNQSLKLFGIYAVEPKEDKTYSEYIAQYEQADVYSGAHLTIQGEDYRAKSDSAIRGTNIPNISVYPGSPYVKLINATANESNKTMGQKIYYEVEAPEDGIYYLSFKFSF